jgi:hypothetical protein
VIARIAADGVVLMHFAFVAFVVLGGLLALRAPRIAWVHVPATAWGAYAELTATVCPLTPLENTLRRRAGDAGYDGGFVEHWIMPLLYPVGLTPGHQRWLGAAVIAINAVVYGMLLWRLHRRRRRPG